MFVCLCHRTLVPTFGSMKSCHLYFTVKSLWKCFPATGRRFYAAVMETSVGNDQSSKTVKHWFCKTPCCSLPISSGFTRDGLPLLSSKCTLVQPSVNCLHHHLTILECCTWQETISVQPFSPSAVQ